MCLKMEIEKGREVAGSWLLWVSADGFSAGLRRMTVVAGVLVDGGRLVRRGFGVAGPLRGNVQGERRGS